MKAINWNRDIVHVDGTCFLVFEPETTELGQFVECGYCANHGNYKVVLDPKNQSGWMPERMCQKCAHDLIDFMDSKVKVHRNKAHPFSEVLP